MLSMLLLLTLSASPAQSYPCESQSVERPALALDAPEWAFVPVTVHACEETTDAAVTMYALGIDAAEPVVGEEFQGDVYQEDLP
jgi:hypothetical protein